MRIRGARAWCPTCTAPLVWQGQVQWCLLYLEALPAWQAGGLGDRLLEGFDRAQIAALLALRGYRGARRAEAWEVLLEFEAETRLIRAALAAKTREKPPAAAAGGRVATAAPRRLGGR